MADTKGVIYILTNRSFPAFVKIGYANNINDRIKRLNSSECTPYAFKLYATYEVDSRLSDKKIHKLIDKLNPDLRSIEIVDGKERKREFYDMSPEDAYSILEAIAEIHDYSHRLKRIPLNASDQKEDIIAHEVEEAQKERASNFSFFKCQIKIGEQIEYGDNSGITATVVGDNKIEYKNKTMTLTALAKLITGKTKGIGGPRYFKYKGEWLNDIRKRLGV